MAKWDFKGVDELLAQYQRLSDNSRDCIGKAIYKGADIVADAVRAEIQALPVANQHQGGISNIQKKGLSEGFGIAPMQDDNGYWNVKLGFDGYNDLHTHKYPNGQPNSVIARSINSGSSYRKKNPFVDRATRAKKSECEKVMKDTVDLEISKLTT